MARAPGTKDSCVTVLAVMASGIATILAAVGAAVGRLT